MNKPQNIHVVFSRSVATGKKYTTDRLRRVTFGVYLDLDELAQLAVRVSHNKSRKGKDGPCRIEVHTIDFVDGEK